MDGTTTQSLTWNGGGSFLMIHSAGQMVKQTTDHLGLRYDKFMYARSGQDELIQQDVTGSVTNYAYGRSNQAKIPTLEQYTQGSSTATYDIDAAGQPIDFTQGGTDYFLLYKRDRAADRHDAAHRAAVGT